MGVAAWHAPRWFRPNRTLRHRASFVSPGMWWGGVALATIRPGLFLVCMRLRTADRFSWREDGKGREERAHRQGPRDDSQLTSWTTDTTERALGAKAHEGGAVLSHLFCGGGLLWLLLSGGRRESVYPPIVRVS